MHSCVILSAARSAASMRCACASSSLIEGADHRRQLAAALDDALGVGVEQIEELALAGHQATEHFYSFIPRPSDSSRFISEPSKPQSASA